MIKKITMVVKRSCSRLSKLDWTPVSVIATLLAVIVALFGPPFWEWYHRPILKITTPSYGYLRWGHEYGKPTGRFFVEIQILNEGRSTAHRCLPLLTAVGEKKEGVWQKEVDWVPVTLQWMLDTYNMLAHRIPTDEKDIIRIIPYMIVLGRVEEENPKSFRLLIPLAPTGNMRLVYPLGEYCFEITVAGEGVSPVKKYFCLTLQGSYSKEIEEMKKTWI